MNRLDDALIQRVERDLGDGSMIIDPDILNPYGRDESGEGPYLPDALIRPDTPDGVRTTLRLCNEAGVPVTARGGGTGKSGGALPLAGGVVVSFERMNKILDIDVEDMVGVVEPGVVLETFQDAVEEAGLFYPPDPASLDSCTIGGNLAENAGGPRAVRYGVTCNYILGLEAALMSGRKLELGGKTVKNVAGYDLTSLVVGSEGTLALATRIQLRLIAKPRSVAAAWATFPSLEEAAGAVRDLLVSGLEPRCLEIMDEESLSHGALEKAGMAPEGKAAILLEMDGWEDVVEERLPAAGEICETHNVLDIHVAQDAASRRRLWEGRRAVSSLLKEAFPWKISEDIGVPVGRMPEVMEAIVGIGRKHGVKVAVYGHAGDGNLHTNILAPDPETRNKLIETAVTELMIIAVEHGGTLSAEHGIGSSKKRWMEIQHPPQELEMMRGIKSLWDPKGLLNPGKIFPSPSS